MFQFLGTGRVVNGQGFEALWVLHNGHASHSLVTTRTYANLDHGLVFLPRMILYPFFVRIILCFYPASWFLCFALEP